MREGMQSIPSRCFFRHIKSAAADAAAHNEMKPVPLLGWQGGESLHEKVLWEKEQMTERYEKSPADWLGFWNGAQSIPTWCR